MCTTSSQIRMEMLSVLSFNCHGFNIGTRNYLQSLSMKFDVMLLQETWLSDENCAQLNDISPDYVVVHSSAMKDKLQGDYMRGRPFGGTAVLYKCNLACNVSVIKVNNARCTAVKFCSPVNRDLIVASVYMPYQNGSACNDIEYECTVGHLQGLMDRNLGCDFIFGGDFNVAVSQDTIASRSL